jgi:hypothetical protein
MLFIFAGWAMYGQAQDYRDDMRWQQKNPMAYRVDQRGKVAPISDEALGLFRSALPDTKLSKRFEDLEADLKTLHPVLVALDGGFSSIVPRLMELGVDPDGVMGVQTVYTHAWNSGVQDCSMHGVLGFATAYYVEHFVLRPAMAASNSNELWERWPTRSAAESALNALCAVAKYDRNTIGYDATFKMLSHLEPSKKITELWDVLRSCMTSGRIKNRRASMPVYSVRPKKTTDGGLEFETYVLSEAEVETIPPSLLGPTERRVRDPWWNKP